LTSTVQLSRIPRSGLGNQLFSLNALLQVAEELGIRPVRPLSASFLALSMVRKQLSGPNLIEAVSEFGKHGERISSSEFDYSSITSLSSLILRSPYLGESFFAVTKRDPLEFFSPPMAPPWCSESEYVAVHMRGGDFAKWNPSAILPTKYYLQAIEAALDLMGSKTKLYVSTDDQTLESWREVTRLHSARLLPNLYSRGNSRSRALGDLGALAGANLVVSSPSTFAIWASLLGSKRVIHSRHWVESRADLGDRFWIDLSTLRSPYYVVEALV
jgi:hypothetical protein